MKKEMTLFEKAKESKVLLNGFLAAILLVVITFVGQLAGQLSAIPLLNFISGVVDGFTRTEMTEESFMRLAEISALYACMGSILLCFLWVTLKEKREFSTIGLEKEGFFVRFIKGFGIGLLMLSAVTVLMWMFGLLTLEQGLDVGLHSIPMILVIIPGWIIQSSSEEILARGWLMNVLGAKHTPAVGLIGSSVIFGLIHIFNPGISVLSILNIMLIGFMFGLYVIHTQDLWGACGMHAAWNFAQANIFGFSVSGLGFNENSLVKFSSQGSNFLTGGAFGPEANIFSTVVILIGIAILAYKLKAEPKGYE